MISSFLISQTTQFLLQTLPTSFNFTNLTIISMEDFVMMTHIIIF
jgi:hypothetical protein